MIRVGSFRTLATVLRLFDDIETCMFFQQVTNTTQRQRVGRSLSADLLVDVVDPGIRNPSSAALTSLNHRNASA